MAKHKGLNIKVGDTMFRDVGKMDRLGLWKVQDALNDTRDAISLSMQGNVSPATKVALHKQDEGLRRRLARVDQLIRMLPASP